MHTLTVISGPASGQSVDVDRELTIGREDADITIPEEDVSRRHATVRPVPDGVAVRDLGSLNGTFVDGQRITEEVVLTARSTMQVGGSLITVAPGDRADLSGRRPAPQGTVRRLPAAAAPPPPAGRVSRSGPQRPSGAPLEEGRPVKGTILRRPALAALALLLVAGAIAGAVLIATSVGDDEQGSAGEAIIDVPIRFTVRDLNRSLVPCRASGATYQVAGQLVAPASGPASAVTLYLHGVILSGQFEWHYKGVPGYDTVTELARRGHTSVLIDRVGYGATRPIPSSGAQACFGAQADHAHQIIGHLRSGRYSLPDSSGPDPKPFEKVALAGYSLGGTVAELEAGSFQDPDALVVVSWADEGQTEYGTPFPTLFKLCSPGRPKPPNGVKGYVPTLPPKKIPPLVSNKADPRVVAAMLRERELDPCGVLLTGSAWFNGVKDKARARITQPFLLIHGIYDVLFHRSAWPESFRHFTGTTDKTRIPITDGQLVMLDEEAPRFRRELSKWLKARGF